MKENIIEGVGTNIRCLYYKGNLCIMTPDENNPHPIITLGCKSIDILIKAVYNIDE